MVTIEVAEVTQKSVRAPDFLFSEASVSEGDIHHS